MKRKRIVGMVLLAGVLLMTGRAPADVNRPAMTVVPADQRLPQTSRWVRAVVKELNGPARPSRLIELYMDVQQAGQLVRWALELQSVVHQCTETTCFSSTG